jgi:hypothetical protein
VRDGAILAMAAVGTLFVILLALHNWRRNRVDLQGAGRLAAARFVLAAVAWAGWTQPVEGNAMIEQFLSATGGWLLSAAIMFVIYLALEPAVRARWPHSIVTWNRVLAGRWKDAQVGSDILLGAASGCLMWMAFKLIRAALGGSGEPTNLDFNLFTDTRQWIGGHAGILGNALRLGILVFLAIFGLRRLLRRDWLAVLAGALLFTMNEGNKFQGEDWPIELAIYVAVYAVLIVMLLRWGLVATIMTVFFGNCFNNLTLGADWKTWYAAPSLATAALLLGIAVWAFRQSLGGRELLGEEAV